MSHACIDASGDSLVALAQPRRFGRQGSGWFPVARSPPLFHPGRAPWVELLIPVNEACIT
jgi:hypothetical protein